MSISRQQLQTLLIPVVVALLSVPFADLAYRWAGLAPSDNLSGLYAAFGEGSYRYRANVATSADWYSGPFTVLTDGLGLRRGIDPATAAEPGAAVDILVLGDSQGYGQCLDYEATVAGGLAGLAGGQGLLVANASVGGHYLRNQMEVARWLHDEQHLTFRRVVVLLTPYLCATPGSYNRARVSAAGDLYEGEPTLVSRAALWAKTHTTIFGRVRNMVRNVMGVEPDNSMLLGFFDTGGQTAERTASLQSVFSELRAWTDSVGAQLEIVYTPLAVELDFVDVTALAEAKGKLVDANAPWRQAQAVAEIQGLPLVDLRPVLAGLVAAGEPVTCRGDPHYNEKTSRACAREIWRALSAQTTAQGAEDARKQ